jgi:hypothetical protein
MSVTKLFQFTNKAGNVTSRWQCSDGTEIATALSVPELDA